MPRKNDEKTAPETNLGNDGRYPHVDLAKLRHPIQDKKHEDYGREYLDPNPFQPAMPHLRQPSLIQTINEQIRAQKHLMNEFEPETPDEADDFEVEEDMDPTSRWENDFEPSIKELRERANAINEQLIIEDELARREAARSPATPVPPAAAPGAVPPEKGAAPDLAAAPGGFPSSLWPRQRPQ